MELTSYKSIKLNCIKLKKPICSTNNYYKIFIKHNNKNLVIQTPTLYLTFGITQMGINKYIDVSLFENDNEIKEFRDSIFRFNEFIQRRIANSKSILFSKKKLTFYDNFKPKTSIYDERLRLCLNDYICYFNENKEKIGHNSIKAKDHVKLLICPSYIWINEEKYGIYWEVLQLKVYKLYVPTSYSFKDDDESVKLINHPVYGKYFDLLKKGVPKQAIKNKLIALNLDPGIIDKSPYEIMGVDKSHVTNTTSNIGLPPPPLPPPPPIPGVNTQFKSSKVKLLDDIANRNFKLKKVDKQKPKPTDTNFKAPSLNEILNKLKTLKKIN